MHNKILRLTALNALGLIRESRNRDQPGAVLEVDSDGYWLAVSYGGPEAPNGEVSNGSSDPTQRPDPPEARTAPGRRGRRPTGCRRDLMVLLCDGVFRTVREIREQLEARKKEHSESSIRDHLNLLMMANVVERDGDSYGMNDR